MRCIRSIIRLDVVFLHLRSDGDESDETSEYSSRDELATVGSHLDE